MDQVGAAKRPRLAPSASGTVLDLDYDFSRLSLRDLVEARDTYHYHLLSKPNVVGTAIGLYLIRDSEPWPHELLDKDKRKVAAARKAMDFAKAAPRHLFNSAVRPYSWPCILAFVREWIEPNEFGGKGRYDAAQILPKTIYLPDGRAAPVCVVQATESELGAYRNEPHLPRSPLGAGLPILIETQGEERMATAGCLVSDGHTTYALTARHACGEPGTPIFSRLREGEMRIGESANKPQLTRLPFSQVYPDFPGRRSFSSLDVGLVRLDTVSMWTSSCYGLPPVGPIADVHERNLSLKLIDQPVVGFGAASGLLRGTIKALFYRHHSVGGYDYVGDFLIAPSGQNHTKPGDSGMVWHLDVTNDDDKAKPTPLNKRDLRPLALEWGGQVFADGDARSAFAVATSLSNVCKLLDVELVTDMDRGVSGYWGRTGHYSIAALAIDQVKDPDLKRLLRANAEIISFETDTIAQKNFDKSVGLASAAGDFVALADVPDEIWKKLPYGKNGREGGRDFPMGNRPNGPEHPTHYADIDIPVGPNGETWRELCLRSPAKNMTVNAWLDFYERAATWAENEDGWAGEADQFRKPLKQGLLPFRVWQFFSAMSGAVENNNKVDFVTAAGLVAHYVGDACQPLHGSRFADGDPSRSVTRYHPKAEKKENQVKQVRYGEGVHSAYETGMISFKAIELLDRIATQLQDTASDRTISNPTGPNVALAVVQLMHDVAKTLDPIRIIDAFEAEDAKSNQAAYNAMWSELGEDTVTVMTEGVLTLAAIWDAAWAAGGGMSVGAGEAELDRDAVRARYIDKKFVPSVTLDSIGPYLK